MELLTKSSESYRLAPTGLTKAIWVVMSLSYLQVLHGSGHSDITSWQLGSVRFLFWTTFHKCWPTFPSLIKNFNLQLAPFVGRLFNTSESGDFDSSCHILGLHHLNLPDLQYDRLQGHLVVRYPQDHPTDLPNILHLPPRPFLLPDTLTSASIWIVND